MADFVVDKAFEVLYDGVKDLIVKNFIFKSLFKDVKSRLDDWAPLIKKMAQHNQKMDRPEKELKALEEVMEKGQELVNKCSKITRWSPFKKYKYAKELLEWQESLKSPLETLKVQEAVNIMEIRDVVDDMQRVMLKQQSAESSSCSTRLELPPLPRLIVGLDGPLNDLKEKLLADDGVSKLVLTAPGGCGKTTLATMFCQDEEVKGIFKNNIIFITVSQKGNLELVVKRLCESVSSPVPTFQNKVHMLQWMQTFFKGRQNPLLLVLDDIWSGSESILYSFQFELSNYKILVTSRSEFPNFGSSYHLKLLDDDKAMELFYHSTSLGDKCSPDQEELSRKIVKRCNGFPLAITVVGRSLSGKPIEIWRQRESEWSKDSSILDSDPETELFLCLQSSLDALDKRLAIVKDCYLDLGSFPEDKLIRVDDLIDMWAELYDIDDDSVCFANVYELANRNLATLVDERDSDMKMEGDNFYGGRFVAQHDLLRELAIYNVKLDQVEQRKRMIIEIRGNKIPKWWREQKCHPIKARLLSITTTDCDMEWPNLQLPEAEVFVLDFESPSSYRLPAFVQKMDKLKVLVVDGENELINFELLGLLPNLKRISLIGLLIGFITNKPMQLKSLKKISFTSCDAEGIGEGVFKMSDAFPNLEELNIDFCDKVAEFLAEICNLIHLKKVSIFNCPELRGLPKEIGDLVDLEVLRVRSCINLPKFPTSVKNLKRLNFLDISECYDIELPKNIGELSNLRKVDMRNCYEVNELPPSVSDLHQLEEVICNDEDRGSLWELFLPTLTNLRVVVIP
ncbi:putative disease resistance protein [Rosa sericea]